LRQTPVRHQARLAVPGLLASRRLEELGPWRWAPVPQLVRLVAPALRAWRRLAESEGLGSVPVLRQVRAVTAPVLVVGRQAPACLVASRQPVVRRPACPA